MELFLHIQNVNTGIVYNVSDIAEPITVTKSLGGEAGKLTCILQKDPNDLLEIANGSLVTFQVKQDNKVYQVFYGWIFTIGTDSDGNYKITAYDQLRYLKNSDVATLGNMTASDIFAHICNSYGLKYKIKTPTSYVPDTYNFDNKTLYSIIERGINLANLHDGLHYYIIDQYGTLVWTELLQEGINKSIDLNEYAGITSFTYERSIDKDTYNRIKLYKDEDKSILWYSQSPENIAKWGILQYLEKLDKDTTDAAARELTENYLKSKNRETETLKLQGEGIIDCIAGKRVRIKLDREDIDAYMWVYSSSHTFTKYEHTMDLEVVI